MYGTLWNGAYWKISAAQELLSDSAQKQVPIEGGR